MEVVEEADFVSGRTRLFGIVGDPIEQVRSPEMFTAAFRRLGRDAILVPIHVRPDDFDVCVPSLLKVQNLDGLVFTIPYKVRACGVGAALGPQAEVVGAINALGRDGAGAGVARSSMVSAASRPSGGGGSRWPTAVSS